MVIPLIFVVKSICSIIRTSRIVDGKLRYLNYTEVARNSFNSMLKTDFFLGKGLTQLPLSKKQRAYFFPCNFLGPLMTIKLAHKSWL